MKNIPSKTGLKDTCFLLVVSCVAYHVLLFALLFVLLSVFVLLSAFVARVYRPLLFLLLRLKEAVHVCTDSGMSTYFM